MQTVFLFISFQDSLFLIILRSNGDYERIFLYFSSLFHSPLFVELLFLNRHLGVLRFLRMSCKLSVEVNVC